MIKQSEQLATVSTYPIKLTLKIAVTIDTTMKYMDIAENRRDFSRMHPKVGEAEIALRVAARAWEAAMNTLLPASGDTLVEVEVDL